MFGSANGIPMGAGAAIGVPVGGGVMACNNDSTSCGSACDCGSDAVWGVELNALAWTVASQPATTTNDTAATAVNIVSWRDRIALLRRLEAFLAVFRRVVGAAASPAARSFRRSWCSRG